MSIVNMTRESLVAAAVSAVTGKSVCVTILCDAALNGAEYFAAFVEDCRALFAANAELPASTGFAKMQKEGVKGASTFYTYVLGLRRIMKDAKIEQTQAAYEKAVISFSKPAKKEPAKPAAKGSEAPAAEGSDKVSVSTTRTPDDLIAALVKYHEAGGLTVAHYAALQAIHSAKPALVAA
jgi:hypothetical protein